MKRGIYLILIFFVFFSISVNASNSIYSRLANSNSEKLNLNIKLTHFSVITYPSAGTKNTLFKIEAASSADEKIEAIRIDSNNYVKIIKMYDDGTNGDEVANNFWSTGVWMPGEIPHGIYNISVFDHALNIHKNLGKINLRDPNIDCIPLTSNVLDSNKVNIVFVGVNFNDDIQYSKFVEMYKNIKARILLTEPYKSNKELFNFYAIGQSANVENYNEGWDQRASESDESILDLADYCGLGQIKIIALVNWHFRSNNGGILSTISFKVTDNSLESQDEITSITKIALHELGHSFGLYDEYIEESKDKFPGTQNNQQCFGPNSLKSCKIESEWSFMLGNGCGLDGKIDCLLELNPDYINEVSCFEGSCYRNDLYRSTFNSFMRSHSKANSYGPVNERLICKKLLNQGYNVGGICQRCMFCSNNQRCINGQCV